MKKNVVIYSITFEVYQDVKFQVLYGIEIC